MTITRETRRQSHEATKPDKQTRCTVSVYEKTARQSGNSEQAEPKKLQPHDTSNQRKMQV